MTGTKYTCSSVGMHTHTHRNLNTNSEDVLSFASTSFSFGQHIRNSQRVSSESLCAGVRMRARKKSNNSSTLVERGASIY